MATVRFLNEVHERAPFPISAIQAHGESESRADSEEKYHKRKIMLFELPPRYAKPNGCGERACHTHQEEVYEVCPMT